MTAISPCPLATNISAIGFISRDIENRRRVFFKGLVYTLGRAISYTGLGIIIFLGASKMNISLLFQGWGERLIGPLLIVIGLFMLGVGSSASAQTADPAALIMPLAGFSAARGDLGLVGVILAGTAGSVAGALFWYAIGRSVGIERLRRWTGRHGRWLTMSPAVCSVFSMF